MNDKKKNRRIGKSPKDEKTRKTVMTNCYTNYGLKTSFLHLKIKTYKSHKMLPPKQ
jgi:hypothetical protein